jgi:hypothetical protein
VTHAEVPVLQKRFATSMDEGFYFLIDIGVHILGNRLIQNKVDAMTATFKAE